MTEPGFLSESTNSDPVNGQDQRKPNKLVLWFDDEPEVRRHMHAYMDRAGRQIRYAEVRDIGDASHYPEMLGLRSDSAMPVVLFVISSRVPNSDELRLAIDRLSPLGIISDLEIGGDALAGLSILTTAASVRPRPELVLLSSAIQPSVERLASNLGVKAIDKRERATLFTLLDVWLGGGDLRSSQRLHHMSAEVDRLQAQIQRLQKEKRSLRKALDTASTDNVPAGKKKTRAGDVPVQTEDREKAQHLTQIVLAHNHDLSNASSLTLSTLEHLCTDKTLVPPVLLADLQRARIAAKHCDVLIQSLASISGERRLARGEPSSVEAAVNDACEILRRKKPDTVDLQIDIESRLPLCTVPTYLLVRVLLNLILNALEAMPQGGSIQISAVAPSRKGKPVRLRVRDSGRGIKKSDLPKVCEPDFSTKGKHHGFGLFIVKRIMADFGGTVTVQSKRGKGTSVFLDLPTA